jgi:hypothetical protein
MKVTSFIILFITFISLTGTSQVSLDINPNFIAYNRYGVKYTVDDFPSPPHGYMPVFPIDDMQKKMSIRFTSPAQKTVRYVKLFSRITGSPGRVKISLKDDNGNGMPVPDDVLESTVEQTLTGWSQISLNQLKFIDPDKVYHIMVEPFDGDFDSTNYVEFISSVSRMPIPFQPFSASSGLKNHIDTQLAYMFDRGDGKGLKVQRTVPEIGSINSINPCFVIECMDTTAIGVPYDVHEDLSICGDNQYGLSIEFDNPIDINYVTLFTCREISDPNDHLYFDLLHDDSGTPVPLFENLELINKDDVGHIVGRAHWFSIDLPATTTLQANKPYYFVLKSPGSVNGEGYKFPLDSTTVSLTNDNNIPTYNTINAQGIESTNGGVTFQSSGQHSDTGIILGLLSENDKIRPIAVFDEVYDFPKTSGVGELVELKITNRNIGNDGNIYAKLYDVETMAEIAYGIYYSVSRNEEKNHDFSFYMPARDLKFIVECGHFNEFTQQVADDGAFFEIRLSKDMALYSDIYSIPENDGAIAHFTLNAGLSNANRNYLILGSITGTAPGFTLPGGQAVLPLNWDPFTDLVLSMVNSVIFSNFLNQLDASGNAPAQLNAPPLPGYAGMTMHYAYCLNNPFDYASNPIEVLIVP